MQLAHAKKLKKGDVVKFISEGDKKITVTGKSLDATGKVMLIEGKVGKKTAYATHIETYFPGKNPSPYAMAFHHFNGM